MSTRKIFLLLIALLIGGATVLMTRSMIPAPGAKPQVEGQTTTTTEVLVASNDMPAGTMIQEKDLKWQVWPQTKDMEGYVIKGKAEMSAYVGNVVRQGMRVGEPVMLGRVVKPGERGFMAAALSPGMRAVSIAVTATSGVAGFVFPGDRVDVIVTHEVGTKGDIERSSSRKVSETILHDIRVLAVDQKMNDQVAEPKVPQIVTLEVLPKQAEGVALAAQLGSLSLALRSIANGADEVSEKREMTWDSDISRAIPGPVNRQGTIQKIKIIRGNESSEAIYDLTQP